MRAASAATVRVALPVVVSLVVVLGASVAGAGSAHAAARAVTVPTRAMSPASPTFVRAATMSSGVSPGWSSVRLRRQGGVVYALPVDAPVIDRFRPPTTPYGSGNRGWEFATSAGSTVRAAADGTVTFAGVVGGTVAVTISHVDGLRTSYSYVDSASVVAGDRVRLGDPVGRSGSRFHFGVRRGDVYLDPASLFAPAETRKVRLVPLGATGPGS